MPQWEYKIETYIDENSLNYMGREGWELVAAAMTMSAAKYIFKRAVAPKKD